MSRTLKVLLVLLGLVVLAYTGPWGYHFIYGVSPEQFFRLSTVSLKDNIAEKVNLPLFPIRFRATDMSDVQIVTRKRGDGFKINMRLLFLTESREDSDPTFILREDYVWHFLTLSPYRTYPCAVFSIYAETNITQQQFRTIRAIRIRHRKFNKAVLARIRATKISESAVGMLVLYYWRIPIVANESDTSERAPMIWSKKPLQFDMRISAKISFKEPA